MLPNKSIDFSGNLWEDILTYCIIIVYAWISLIHADIWHAAKAAERGKMKKTSMKTKVLTTLLALCMALMFMPVTVSADGVNYIDKINVTYSYIDYKAGDVPQATAAVTAGNCTVAYEYWRELYQKEEGGVWSGTGRYWYSDPDKMASLSADKQITQFEAGHHYSYNIVLATDSGYLIGNDETVVSVGDYEWGTPGNHTNLEIKEMSTQLRVYGIYAIDLPDESTDQVIMGVSITNVNKNLDSSTPITFTAQVGSDGTGKFDITEECWEIGGSTSNDVIKSTDATPRAPIAGGEYWYSIVLTAKDGYVFSSDFSDGGRIKEGSGVSFTLDGTSYDSRFQVSDDGKTLTAWEFMDPVTAAETTQKVISQAVISDVKFDYLPGDAPQKSAKVFLPADADKYEVVYESWEEMEDGTPVAYWYSDDSKYFSSANKITQFENGKSYMYSITLKAKDGYTFANNCSVVINNTTQNAINVIMNQDQNELFIMAVKTIKPTPDYRIIEGANGVFTKDTYGTLTVRANGNFSKFTEVKVDGSVISPDNYTAREGSTIITLNAAYLNTLSVGRHTLTVVFTDGECSAGFESMVAQSGGVYTPVKSEGEAPTPEEEEFITVAAPQTGTDSHFVLWLALFFICAGTAVVGVKKR